MSQRRILVVDDEKNMQHVLKMVFEDMGHDVLLADNGKQAFDLIGKEPVDLLVTDLRMPVMDGITLLRTLHQQGLVIPAIVMTAHGTVETAVEAMKYGACDYILRPFEIETVELAANRALNLIQAERENLFLRNELDSGWQEFIGQSSVMQQLYKLIEQIGPSGSTVLIVGETGTGKELVARSIHRTSGRPGLFVPINCAAIPESILESELFGHVRGAYTGAHSSRVGKFEVSDTGTLFLDEITEMPIELQAKLLRVLQENCIERLGSNHRIDLDLRIIAATNQDPEEAIAAGKLRQDLYFRLNVFRIDVPPLRDRPEDIPILSRHFLELHAHRMGREAPLLTDKAVEQLKSYTWPGNVRELENIMQRSLVLGTDDRVSSALLPGNDTKTAPASEQPENWALSPRMEAFEKELIQDALAAADDNKSRAARLLDISERTLWYKLKKYAIS